MTFDKDGLVNMRVGGNHEEGMKFCDGLSLDISNINTLMRCILQALWSRFIQGISLTLNSFYDILICHFQLLKFLSSIDRKAIKTRQRVTVLRRYLVLVM